MDIETVQKLTDIGRRLDTQELPEKSSDLISPFMSLAGRRVFWPMSSVDYTNPQALDIGGGGYHLTNNATATFGQDNLIPYVNFVAASNQYLSRADGGAANWADITGLETFIVAADRGLTILCWFFLTAVPGAQQFLISKLLFGANLSYFLSILNTGVVRHGISNTGAAIVQQDSSNIVNTNAWNFTALRFVPSTSVDVWLNGVKASLVAGIPASIFDGTAIFHISGFDNGAGGVNSPFNGRISLVPLSAIALSDATISSLFQQTRGAFGV